MNVVIVDILYREHIMMLGYIIISEGEWNEKNRVDL